MGILVRNRYQVLERLGTGGGGSVYAVADLGLDPAGDRRVALKALFIDGDADETLLTLLRQEFRVLARLRHPRLARVFDFGRLAPDNGLEGSRGQPGYFFTRDLIEGEDLFDATARSSISQICQLALQTARLLDVLHGAGMIHGDFKPANVIVDRGTFAPHLIDFGLVRGEGTSVLSGTAAYLSPEVISGRAADRRADLYAFGIALYQVIVGGPPLPRASLSELIDWHLHGDPLVPSTVKERRCGDVIPGALDALISRLTERDPDRRYPSAAEVSAALERIISDLDAPIPPEDLVFVPPASGDRLGTCLRELETRARERLLAASGIKGTCAAVVVKGEAGNGKTDLVRELCWRVQLAGVEALRVTVPSGDARVHGPLVDLLDQVAGLVGLTHPLAEARGVSDESARGGGRLLGDEEIPSLGEISGTLGGDEQVDRYAMDQRVVDFLHEAAGRMPLLLVLDAVDQADPETRRSLRFIAHTVERSASLLLVLAQRSGIDDLFDDLPQVAISGLALDDVTRLLAEAAGRDDPILARAIYEHTGGNAQFVLDVMRALWEKRWPIHPDLAVLVPPASLNELARRRWESVGGRGRDVLAALAVVGRPQSGLELLDILDRVDGREGIAPDEEVGLPFERLEAEGWLTRDADGRWAFRDGVAAHRVRQILDDETRRSLHWALYERLGAGPGDVAVRARHALAAGRADLAWVDLVPALATLRRLGAYRRAIDLACAMVEALDEADDRLPEVRLGLG
ncbi:MAG: protein kinase, partial [Deltaproteobacteria bacterium]|nr:protein kinase [Deltaproteobacteria bacterium]